jgi:hypothetical protein
MVYLCLHFIIKKPTSAKRRLVYLRSIVPFPRRYYSAVGSRPDSSALLYSTDITVAGQCLESHKDFLYLPDFFPLELPYKNQKVKFFSLF